MFFAYYAKWIPCFSDCLKDLKIVSKFPLDHLALDKFKKLKQSVAQATLQAIDDNKPFVVECDISEVAVSAILNQCRRPVSFFRRKFLKVSFIIQWWRKRL